MLILKFLKFCTVGFSGMLIDFGVTYLLKERLRVNKYIANSTGFILAATSNYILNRVWTFESHSEQIAVEFFSFLAISLIGLLLNNAVLYLFTDRFKLNFYLSKLFAIGVVTVWNFVMNYLITFA